MSAVRSAVLSGAMFLAGCSAPTGTAGVSAALTDATPTTGDPAVVALVGAPLGCTGTLVGERAVLTAAHCGVQRDPDAVQVFFGSELGAEGTYGDVLYAVAHPDAGDTADDDLALLLLAEPAPARAVPIATDPRVADAPPVAVRLVGFGVSAAGAGDDGVKREGTGVTTEVMPGYVQLAADPSLPCNGDSGGPVFVDDGSGEVLAAVVSRGDAACDTQGKATRVDAHIDFIQPRLDAWAAGEVPGEIGDACRDDEACLSNDCLEEREMCSSRCVSGRGDCPGGFTCDHLGGVDFYCIPEPLDDSGCSAVGRGSARTLAPLLLVPSFALLRRRR